MILFLDFTPIEFMGGTEKWMSIHAKKLDAFEPTQLVSVHKKISNFYGKLVAKRNYTSRVNSSKIHNYSPLTFLSFVPFTRKWREAKAQFSSARIIYIKYDILEILIVAYFLGVKGFKKTIAGIHSPYIYPNPTKFFDYFHNFVYTSRLSGYLLSKVKKVHVINTKDEQYLKSKFSLKNVIYIPNWVRIENKELTPSLTSESKLRVLFIGELNLRKGVDILIDIIKLSPDNFSFDITSDGPLRPQIQELARLYRNCHYHGYLSNAKIQSLYKKADVLILPSRGEGFPLVILDALSHGVCIIDSSDIRLGLPKYIEYTSKSCDADEYIGLLTEVYKIKRTCDFGEVKKRIFKYCNNKLSEKVVFPKLKDQLFELGAN